MNENEKLQMEIAKLYAKTSACSEVIQLLLEKSGYSKLDALKMIQDSENKHFQKFLEFVEDVDPALSARIDERGLKDLVFLSDS
jgi:hypothetical protein